jgi:hypothetical protein
MLNITIYDVMEQHISNDPASEKKWKSYSMKQSMELRRAQWLERNQSHEG